MRNQQYPKKAHVNCFKVKLSKNWIHCCIFCENRIVSYSLSTRDRFKLLNYISSLHITIYMYYTEEVRTKLKEFGALGVEFWYFQILERPDQW